MILYAVTTGQVNLWATDLWLSPNPFYALFLPYLYLALLGAGAFVAWYRTGRSESLDTFRSSETIQSPAGLSKIWWIWLFIMLVTAFGYLIYAQTRPGRTYDANDLGHFAGQPIADPAARDRQAWLVDPAVDQPQKAIYGPFDIYNAGRYRVTFRLKLPQAVETGQEIARLQVNATANLDELATQPILTEHFSRPDLYHDLILTIDNPRRQALSFEVHYLGLVPLAIDEVTITTIKP
jgi:hypothetical protein